MKIDSIESRVTMLHDLILELPMLVEHRIYACGLIDGIEKDLRPAKQTTNVVKFSIPSRSCQSPKPLSSVKQRSRKRKQSPARHVTPGAQHRLAT
jgi:hypothetical protein